MIENINAEAIKKYADHFKGRTIAVVGDVMLDRYFWGSVTRVSPEAPVPVIDIESETFHLGGAANVASNLKSLGIKPLLCGIIGDDNSGRLFSDIAGKTHISCAGLYADPGRPTTVKTRVFGNNQQIARLDREFKSALSSEAEDHIFDTLANTKNLSGIIFSDYNKGCLSPSLIRKIIDLATDGSVPVFVDPKFENFFEFQGVTVFKPNKKEAQSALETTFGNSEELMAGGLKLLEKLNCKHLLLTLGAEGLMIFSADGKTRSIPTHARHVADVSGAGDTTIATLAAFMAGGAEAGDAAAIANIAAGLVVEEPGIVSIRLESILEYLNGNE